MNETFLPYTLFAPPDDEPEPGFDEEPPLDVDPSPVMSFSNSSPVKSSGGGPESIKPSSPGYSGGSITVVVKVVVPLPLVVVVLLVVVEVEVVAVLVVEVEVEAGAGAASTIILKLYALLAFIESVRTTCMACTPT